jgi:G:T-mismatch repair DNA endonuclease (very short patch repair protein)
MLRTLVEGHDGRFDRLRVSGWRLVVVWDCGGPGNVSAEFGAVPVYALAPPGF